MKEDDIIA